MDVGFFVFFVESIKMDIAINGQVLQYPTFLIYGLSWTGIFEFLEGNLWTFQPILVTLFLVGFGDEVTKILHNSLFIFHFALPYKQKT